MTQANVYTSIYDKLVADQSAGSFYDAIANSAVQASGKAIWPVQAPHDEALPLCVFDLVTDIPDRYFGSSDLNATAQIDLYGDAINSTPEALVAIHDKLLTLLFPSGVPALLTMTNHTNAQIECTDRGALIREEDSYRITSQWRVYATIT